METLTALLCCAIFISAHTATLPSHHLQCEKRTEFWDGAMEICQTCDSYCRDHAVSGVTEYCEEQCPDYMNARRCDPVTEFWDGPMEICQTCDSYCKDHAVMDVTEYCEEQCPTYMKARAGEFQPKSPVSWPVYLIGVAVLCFLALPVAVVVVAVLYKRGKLCPSPKLPQKAVSCDGRDKLLPGGFDSSLDIRGVTKDKGEMYHPVPHAQPTT